MPPDEHTGLSPRTTLSSSRRLPTPPARRISILAAAACVALLASGCYSRLTHQQHFVAQDPATGQVSVLRLTVEASTGFHDLEFRAGYVPTTAIDEVVRGRFEHIFEPPTTKQNAIEQTQEKIVEQALADLRAAFAQPWETGRNQVRLAEDKLLEARTLVNRSADRATREKPDAPEEKFVIAVSNDPAAVFKAFADSIAQQTQQDTLVSSVIKLRRRTELQQTLQDEAARKLWISLVPAPAAPATPAAPEGAGAPSPAEVRARLVEYGHRLNDYVNAAP